MFDLTCLTSFCESIGSFKESDTSGKWFIVHCLSTANFQFPVLNSCAVNTLPRGVIPKGTIYRLALGSDSHNQKLQL